MTRRGCVTSIALAIFVFAATAALLHAQSFDVKVGQWEYTLSGMKIAEAELAKMPPAIRAQIEASMKNNTTNRSCLTAKDLRELNLANTDDEGCKVTSRKITATTADIAMTCGGNDPRTQTMHFEALSRESVRGTIKSTGGAGTTEMTITGKWLAAECKGD